MDLISCDSITKEFIENLFSRANKYKLNEQMISEKKNFSSKILINAFFEPSTRTSFSFESAMYKLGGKVITFHKDVSSINKGETFKDTIKTLCSYGDILVIRHPEKDKMKEAIKYSSIPVINAGDGNGEHPTQALLDLYTINNYFKLTSCCHILFVGDAKNSRTIHSLVKLLHLYPSTKIYFLPFKNQEPDSELVDYIKLHHNQIDVIQNWETLNHVLFDVVYITRFQKERTNNNENNNFIIDINFVNKLKKKCIILHPFPRNKELDENVDEDSRARYFEQMQNGIYIRMALLHYLLSSFAFLS
tara:strand:+ start:105 stop:1016 length:912 start_codon:yes stop_codon:yes gene_type:complete